MVINFANLPQKAIGRICKYVNNESILQMREVSKSTKEIVDIFIVRTRKTEIRIFSIEPNFDKQGTEADMWFVIQNDWDHCVWKSCFKYVMNKLKIDCFKLEDNVNQTNILHGIFIRIQNRISVTLNVKDVERVFEHLKPFIRMATFRDLRLNCCTRQILHACTHFFGGITVDKLVFESMKSSSHYKQYVKLIRKVRAERVFFVIRMFTREDIGWLPKLYDIVKILYVYVWRSSETALNPVSITRELISRKCKYLNIYFGRNMVVRLADTEALLQVLHNADRKALIKGWTDGYNLNATIGICSIKTENHALGIRMETHITMEHLGSHLIGTPW